MKKLNPQKNNLRQKKIFTIGTEGGSIDGFEIKKNNKIIKFAYKVSEYYDDEFNYSNTQEVEVTEFTDFWLFLLQNYPLYKLYPVFIDNDYKKHVDILVTMAFFNNPEYSEQQKQKWLKAVGNNFDDFNSFQNNITDDFWDDTPDIAAIDQLKTTSYYKELTKNLNLTKTMKNKKHTTIKTIDDFQPSEIMKYKSAYNYQNELTEKLDKLEADFDQNIINEIILWKLNRYAKLDPETLDLINQIDRKAQTKNDELTKKILRNLLTTKGIGLPMASTILRFANPKVYQIIDQRVYRLIMGEELKLNGKKDTEIKHLIEKYLHYLNKLKKISNDKEIPFKQSDRILYAMDKVVNKDIKIKY